MSYFNGWIDGLNFELAAIFQDKGCFVHLADYAMTDGTKSTSDWRRCVCKGCRKVFQRKPGSAGLYCCRECYQDPTRPNRPRNSFRIPLLRSKHYTPKAR